MSLEYVNRRGDRYFVLQGKTKSGKPKYYCSRKSQGVTLDRMPDGFEIRESPTNATVSIRKIRPSRITPWEGDMVSRLARQLAPTTAIIVDVEPDSLVIYSAEVASPFDRDTDELLRSTDRFGTSLRDFTVRNANYLAMLRFALTDEQNRLYSAERWCFLGSIDRWIPLQWSAELETLAKKYLPHVGRQSFFELT